MNSDEFLIVEKPAIEILQKLKWNYIKGDNLSPELKNERKSFKHVLLKKNLKKSIKKLNPWINEENLNKVIKILNQIHNLNLIEANKKIYQILTKYISVEQDLGLGKKNQTVKIIDFDNYEQNDFTVTNQFKVAGINQNIIPDIILFVNGLPLAVIECKSPFITNPMEAGINQLLRYCNNRKPEEN